MTKVLFNSQTSNQEYKFSQSMCSEEASMTKVQTSNQEHHFTKGMRFEEPGITNVLFIIQTNDQEY